jgi:hypothetical protein
VVQEAYVHGVSTRSVDDLVKAMGMTGISKSQVSRLCEEIDHKVKAFLSRPIEGDWPYLWIDATYVKVRREYQEFRARGRFSSLADEPFAEHDGELGLGLEPFARRPFPFVSRVVQNQV